MSYILDALRKAESEREHGRVPGVHAQPGFGSGALPSLMETRRGLPWVALLGGAVVVLVAMLVWLLMRRDAAPSVAAAPVASTAAPVVAPPVGSPTAPTTLAATTIAPATFATTTDSMRPNAAPVFTPAPMPTTAPAPTPTSMPVPSTSKPRHADSTPEIHVYAQSELPPEIRSRLPLLAVGGSMYSPKPADRILIINGQVLHEGERITPELLLIQIKLKAAVLGFKGYRYELEF